MQTKIIVPIIALIVLIVIVAIWYFSRENYYSTGHSFSTNDNPLLRHDSHTLTLNPPLKSSWGANRRFEGRQADDSILNY